MAAVGLPRCPALTVSGVARQPGPRLRLRSGVHQERPVRDHQPPAAAHRPGDPDVRARRSTRTETRPPASRPSCYQAPLGTYLGWNLTASGFFAGRGCGFVRRLPPVRETKAERERTGDPRPSVEERYGTLEGYTCVVAARRGRPWPSASSCPPMAAPDRRGDGERVLPRGREHRRNRAMAGSLRRRPVAVHLWAAGPAEGANCFIVNRRAGGAWVAATWPHTVQR